MNCWFRFRIAAGPFIAALALVAILAECGGGGGTGQSQPTAPQPSSEFLFAANVGVINGTVDGRIATYGIDANGDLSSQLSSIVGPAYAQGIALDGTGKFLYVSEWSAFSSAPHSVYGYLVSASSGALTSISGSPFYSLPPLGPAGIVVEPAGKFLFAADDGDKVVGFDIGQANGGLTLLANSPFEAGGDPREVATDAAGKFLYTTNGTSADVSGFAISAATGTLTPVPGSGFSVSQPGVNPAYGIPRGIAVRPDGKFVYAAVYNAITHPSGFIVGFVADSATGTLTALPGSQAIADGYLPNAGSLRLDPGGRFLYAAVLGGIAAFSVDSATGELTPISGSPFLFTSSGPPFGLVVDPSGRFLYCSESSNSNDPRIWGFSINATSGGLVPLSGSPFRDLTGFAPGLLSIVKAQ